MLWLLSSCEKSEDAIVLPPPGTSRSASVTMGPNYDKQVFFDFESGQPVYTSDPRSWDIAFEASRDGYHAFLNCGQIMYAYNTHQTDMAAVKSVPASTDPGWRWDNPSGFPNGTAMGEWMDGSKRTKGEVYLIQLSNGGFQKLRMISAGDMGYAFEWMPLGSSGSPTRVQVAKDTAYNFIHFSFSKGAMQLEPVKSTWDVVFTRYLDSVYDNSRQVWVPYSVTGVLLNPCRTNAAADSIHDFAAINLSMAGAAPLSPRRNAIGYDWKSVDLGGGGALFTVNPRKCYLLGTRKEQLYKLHFKSFYNTAGEKGTPLFEYERLR